VRALLIVNSHATSTTRLRRDVIVRALSSAVELEVVQTRYRGHATSLAAAARGDGFGLVLTLGGDGTVNEAVNGILGAATAGTATTTGSAGTAGSAPTAGRQTTAGTHTKGATTADGHTTAGSAGPADSHTTAGSAGPADSHTTAGSAGPAGGHTTAGSHTASGEPGAGPVGLPALGALPGGNANVFTHAIGLPADPVDAAGQILQALSEGRHRSVGLGLAGDRYFTFNAGLGLDAEVVRAVDGRRALGRTATPALYVRMTLRQFYRVTDRRHPPLMLERDGHAPVGPLFLGAVSNTTPWTYLGHRPVHTNPEASFDSGLDLFALRSMRTISTVRTIWQMLSPGRPLRGRSVLTLHDQAELTLRSARPVAFQVDGEYMGEHECVRFVSVPNALRVIV
jgi:diacylglycerol kinase family enzyme